MNTHAIIAYTPDGRRFELGRFGTLEKAASLARRLSDELGDEFCSFEYVELDPEREFCEALAELGIGDFHAAVARRHA